MADNFNPDDRIESENVENKYDSLIKNLAFGLSVKNPIILLSKKIEKAVTLFNSIDNDSKDSCIIISSNTVGKTANVSLDMYNFTADDFYLKTNTGNDIYNTNRLYVLNTMVDVIIQNFSFDEKLNIVAFNLKLARDRDNETSFTIIKVKNYKIKE